MWPELYESTTHTRVCVRDGGTCRYAIISASRGQALLVGAIEIFVHHNYI